MVDLKELNDNCKNTIEHFKKELQKVRTGRASSGLLEGITVDYYGSQVPLIQLGMVNSPEPRLVTIQVYDASAVASIEKAILQSDLGITPNRDGNLIRLNIPPLTEERRKDFMKKLSKVGEDTKVAIRSHRRDAIDVLKKQEKDKKITEDELRRGQDEVQKITDKFIAEIDTLLAVKEKEVMEV